LAVTTGNGSAVKLARPSHAPAATNGVAAGLAPCTGSGINWPATLADVVVALNKNTAAIDQATLALNDIGRVLNRVADELAQYWAELAQIFAVTLALLGAAAGVPGAITTSATIHEAPIEAANYPPAPTATGGASAGPTACPAGSLVLRR
jgi:hypothetical protein